LQSVRAADNKRYQTKHYNLDVIISVGYRVKSHRETQFRIWATQAGQAIAGTAEKAKTRGGGRGQEMRAPYSAAPHERGGYTQESAVLQMSHIYIRLLLKNVRKG
jgi:hypothetical protein